MEIFYKAYSKLIQNKLHYFIKKFQSFPEYEGVADTLEGFGMHTDFNKACEIAGAEDADLRKKLFQEIQDGLPLAKVIELKVQEDENNAQRMA